jgi:FkbH-like protein
MELEEVKAAHPGIECVLFPSEPSEALELLYRLRDMFGRSRLSEEDALRRESLRSAQQFRESASGNGAGDHGDLANSEELLVQAKAAITFNVKDAATNPRSLELVNKTNQFNLNGRRYTESEWHQLVTGDGRFLISAAYEDKFGKLGTIAVLGGEVNGDVATVKLWVMSCRAFARRVEHQSLRQLFDRFGVKEIVFEFAATPRNEPTQQFFRELLGHEPNGAVRISREHFTANAPALYHTVSAT